MPEGNEIYRYAQLHRETFVGKTICVETPNGRFPDAALLTGRKLKSVLAHGKHLGYDFGRDRKLHVHLGRFGDFTEGKMPFPEAKGALRMRWSTRTDWLELRGAIDCSVYTDQQWQALENRLGADPLALNADPSPAFAYVHKAKLAIGCPPDGPNRFRRHRKHLSGRVALPRKAESIHSRQRRLRQDTESDLDGCGKAHGGGHGGPAHCDHPIQRPPPPNRKSKERRNSLRLSPSRQALFCLRIDNSPSRNGRQDPLLVPNMPAG